MSIAAQFDNQKALMFLNHGMDAELIQMQESQVRAAEQLRKSKEGMEEFDTKQRLVREGSKAFEEENPNATVSEKLQNRLELIQQVTSAQKGMMPRTVSAEVQFMNTVIPQLMKPTEEGGLGMDAADAATEARKRWMAFKTGQTGGNTSLTISRQVSQDVKEYREKLAAEKNEDGSPKYTKEQIADMAAAKSKELLTKSQPLSGNRQDQLVSMSQRIDYANQTIDKTEALLKKHCAITGLGGKVTRPAEVVGNWFGSNETDRAEFRRYISLLHEWGARILNESGSRPLSAEENRILAIIPGLSMGDTTANTVRGLKELQGLFKQMKTNLDTRSQGLPRGTGTAPEKPAPGGNWWKKLPDKRSEIDPDSEVG